MRNEEVPEILSVKEAADFLKLARGTLYRYAEDGVIPCVKIGPTNKSPVRFIKSELIEYVNQHRRKAI